MHRRCFSCLASPGLTWKLDITFTSPSYLAVLRSLSRREELPQTDLRRGGFFGSPRWPTAVGRRGARICTIHLRDLWTYTCRSSQQHTTTHNNTQQHTTTHNNTQQHTTTHNNNTTTTQQQQHNNNTTTTQQPQQPQLTTTTTQPPQPQQHTTQQQYTTTTHGGQFVESSLPFWAV